jgi:mono/diheme cytochrome c family protein
MARYLAELYLSRTNSDGLREAAVRARSAADDMTHEGTPVRYLRAIFLGDDETCFHLYEAGSEESVREASRRAAIPVERVTEALDVDLEAPVEALYAADRRTLVVVYRVAMVIFASVFGLLAGGCGGGNADSTASGSTVEKNALVGDPEQGKEVFLTAGCGTCHTFKDAGTTKEIGPNLDLVVATYDDAFVKKSIEDPAAYIEKVGPEPGSIGGDQPYHATMPSFGSNADTPDQQLDQQELADVVAFLTQGR